LVAIEQLESAARARAWALHVRGDGLARERAQLLAEVNLMRTHQAGTSALSAFGCAIIHARMTWVSSRAAALASARGRVLERAAAFAHEARHWGACRRGLQRRASRTTAQWPG